MARNYRTILVESADSVCRITLNRPERRNALGAETINELIYALADAHEDAAVRAIVITGAGKVFSAGGDFSQMGSGPDPDALPHKGDFKDCLLQLLKATKPVIARVNGHAMGGGLGIVAACTFAVASADAKLGTPEINVGLFPFMIMAVLERHVPRRRLTQMFLAGERLTADDAARLGLVNEVVPTDELDSGVERFLDIVRSKSPRTIELGLRAMYETESMSLEAKLPVLSERLLEVLGTEDAAEGLSAFMAKREPVWKGR